MDILLPHLATISPDLATHGALETRPIALPEGTGSG